MHQNEKNNAFENTIDEMKRIATSETFVNRGFRRMSKLNRKKITGKIAANNLKKNEKKPNEKKSENVNF